MSRIGKKPIPIYDNVKVLIKDSSISVEGPKGKLSWDFPSDLTVKKEGQEILVTRPDDSKTNRSLHGLTRVLIANMVEGVSNGFSKTLEIKGVGYSAEMKGKSLFLNIGFSHPVLVTPPNDVNIEIPSNLKVKVSGINKQRVGQIAAKIRSISPPEPYKGKGIRYEGEYVRRKAGKTVGAS